MDAELDDTEDTFLLWLYVGSDPHDYTNFLTTEFDIDSDAFEHKIDTDCVKLPPHISETDLLNTSIACQA